MTPGRGPEREGGLKRVLGFPSLAFYGVGLILGAGIYSILGRAAGVAGDALWLSFAVGSLAALFTGLSYAELATMFPRAGAEYVYLMEAWPHRPRLAPLAGYALALSSVATCATVAIAFGGYAGLFFDAPAWLFAGGVLLAVALFNVVGVRQSSWMNMVFTLVEAAGLVALIVVGARDPDFGAAFLASPHAGVLGGAALVFFAYLGFEDIANLAEEAKRPERAIPRAILVAVAVSATLYVLVALASVALVPPRSLAESASPLSEAMRAGAPSLAGALGGVALFATANTALIAMLAGSRMLYGLSRGGDAPASFARVLPRVATPAVAIVAILAGAIVLLPLGRVEVVGSVASLAALAAFVSVNACVVKLRRARPDLERPFRLRGAVKGVPIVPILGVATAAVLLTQFEPVAYVIFAGVVGAVALARVLADRARSRRARHASG